MKKALMIAYHYHPDLSVGAVRTVKFAKYMPENDWSPVVLTVNAKYYKSHDTSSLSAVYPICRTCKWPVIDDITRALKSLLKRKRAPAKGTAKPDIVPSISDTFNKTGIPLWKRFWNSLSRIPDEHMGWLIPGTFKAIRMVHGEKIKVIYTSGPPYTCHVIGLIVSYLTGKPLVADFRDPWSTTKQPQEIETAMTKWLSRFLEKRVIYRAQKVLVSTPELKEILEGIYGKKVKNKIHTIYNGFDEDDFKELKKRNVKPNRPLTLLYAGNLYKGRDPYALLEALGELLQDGIIVREEIKIVFQGSLAIDMSNIRNMIDKFNLAGLVEFRPAVPRQIYNDLIFQADILILVQAPNQAALIPAKTFEYLVTGNEIIALVPEGAAARFLRKFENVHIADIFDKEGIKHRLIEIIKKIRSDHKSAMIDEETKKYSRRRLAGEFCKILDEIVQN